MRLCLPTLDDRGREGTLSAHFGSAPYLTVVDMDTEQDDVLVNRNAHHAPGTCEAVRALGPQTVDAVVCRGLGRRAHAALRKLGIAVYVADAGSVGSAVHAFRAGHLMPLAEEAACHGGHYGGGHYGERHHHCSH
jgi:predicted Fe-Mo cluster-binding NifX family protein